ncbi:MAG: CapA family protein [Myxococcota bacterium]|nr:CapA family protein [Myxococcota bacterium]
MVNDPPPTRRGPRPLAIIPLIASLALGPGCGTPHELDVTLQVFDELGAVLQGVTARWPDGELVTDDRGKARLVELPHPVMVVLSADGFLDEPVPVGWDDDEGTVEVTLLGDGGGGRLVVHCGGDVMFGRRYVDPDEEGDEYGPGDGLIVPGDGGSSARTLVADLAPGFAAAHLRMVNHEAVIGSFDPETAYPGKRWILQSDPDSLAGLDEMGVDLVVLGNNHLRDHLDDGVSSTLEAVRGAGYADVGGGADADGAETPVSLDRQGTRIGVLSYTSVDGDYVNDAYPLDGETPPDEVDAESAWQWEARVWGWNGAAGSVPVDERRIGSAWAEIAGLEGDLDADQRASLWSSAVGVYPELQDWVARRGHGGGASWDELVSPGQIAGLASQVDLVIVNLHSGYQFASDPSPRLRDAAVAAVAAGADMVVGHHPHVLQGIEFVDGKPVVWSLGNLVFDQDFLSTFPSAFLRTVWEDGVLLQARLVPLTLEAYRPVPVVDAPARHTLRRVWAASLRGATARRGEDRIVRAELPAAAEPDIQVGFVLEHNTARIEPGAATVGSTSLSLKPGEIAPLPAADGLIWSPLTEPAPADVQVGRSLFAWGGFEDADTDADADDATHWELTPTEDELVVAERAWSGRRCLELNRNAAAEGEVLVRQVARITLRDHRLWTEDGEPADGPASYSLHAAVRVQGQEELGALRLVYYHFDDSDPTVDPTSDPIRERDYPLDANHGDIWRDLWIDLPAADLADADDGRPVNAVLLYVVMAPATKRYTSMHFDDVELVEWRPAADQPAIWGAWDHVRSVGDDAAEVDVRTLGW